MNEEEIKALKECIHQVNKAVFKEVSVMEAIKLVRVLDQSVRIINKYEDLLRMKVVEKVTPITHKPTKKDK